MMSFNKNYNKFCEGFYCKNRHIKGRKIIGKVHCCCSYANDGSACYSGTVVFLDYVLPF